MKLITIIMALLFAGTVNAGLLKPKTVKEFKKSSVRIYNLKMNSGGTGSILKSTPTGSHILTNKHVCRLVEPGGYVVRDGKKFLVTHYKKFPDHDLCIVRVGADFGVTLKVSKRIAKATEAVYVSGHPNLLPHIVTKGHMSDDIRVSLIVGVRKCTSRDLKKDPMTCMFFGGMPVVEHFESKVVSNLIKPGSSGSAVFNVYGEIVGVVFAGSGRGFSHGFIVPQKYIVYFLAFSEYYAFTKAGTPVESGEMSDGVFNYSICDGTDVKLCQKSKDNMIWRKYD